MTDPWAPRRERESVGGEVEPWGADVVTEDDPPPPTPQLPARIQNIRFARDSTRTTQQKIDYAYFAAYSLTDGPWRSLNIVFVYVVAIPGHVLCDFAKWAYFDKLSRFLIAVPTTVFALFCLNHIPLVQWAVPDAFDVSMLWSDPPGTVVVDVPVDPLVLPAGGVE